MDQQVPRIEEEGSESLVCITLLMLSQKIYLRRPVEVAAREGGAE